MDVKQKILDKSEKSFSESKRWVAAIWTVCIILAIFISSAILIGLSNGKYASDITQLANITIMAICGISTLVIGGQNFVDFRSINSLETIHKAEIENKNIVIEETKNENINIKEERLLKRESIPSRLIDDLDGLQEGQEV